MKNFKFVLVALSAILIVGSSQAQVSFHAGGALPLSDLGTEVDLENQELDENVNALSAAMGVNVGAKVAVPVLFGFKVFGSVDVNYNPLKKDIRDKLKDIQEALNSKPDMNFKKYISIPISAGLEYACAFGNNMSVYVDGGLVFNCLKITNSKLEVEDLKTLTTVSSKMATSFGFKVGGGLWFTKHVGVNVNYFATGKHTITQEKTIETALTNNTVELPVKPEPKLGLFTFGIAFKI